MIIFLLLLFAGSACASPDIPAEAEAEAVVAHQFAGGEALLTGEDELSSVAPQPDVSFAQFTELEVQGGLNQALLSAIPDQARLTSVRISSGLSRKSRNRRGLADISVSTPHGLLGMSFLLFGLGLLGLAAVERLRYRESRSLFPRAAPSPRAGQR